MHVVRSLKARERTTDDLLRELGKKSRLASQDQEGRGVHAYALPKSRERSGDDLLRRSNEKKNRRLPSLVLAGAPQKTGERLVGDLFNLGEKTKTTSATAYALPAKSAGSAPAVQCSRSLRKSLRDRLQGHDRGMPRKNKCRMHVSCRPALPERARERLVDDLFSRDEKTKAAGSLAVPTGVSGQKSARSHLDEFGKSAFIQSARSRAAYAKFQWFC